MIHLKILLLCCLFANANGKPTVIVKGYPFSISSQISLNENYINSIKKNDLNRDIFLNEIKNVDTFIYLKKYLHNLVKRKKHFGKNYDLRIGFYFQDKKETDIFYFDRFQRMVYKGMVYKLTDDELKYVFSFVCMPNFKNLKKSYSEQLYWQYSPKCK